MIRDNWGHQRTRKLRYEQVMELVEKLIAERGLRPGDRIPTNNELARSAHVSLISVRRALDELERAGRIERHQGVGTFVAGERIVSDPAMAGSLLATLTGRQALDAIETLTLEIVAGMPSPTIARALNIASTEKVWRISRLRVIRRRPMILEQAVIPVHLAPTLDEVTLRRGGSLYRFLEDRHGLRDAYEEQHLMVTQPTGDERKLLELGPGQHVVRIRGVSFSQRGDPFDCFQQVYSAAHFAFYLSGQTDRHVIQRSDVLDWEVVPVAQLDDGASGDTVENQGGRLESSVEARQPGIT
jgi:DNA-binding GntR family transcriptional regulator